MVRVGACRILLWAEAIAANVKSQQVGISTLETPNIYFTHSSISPCVTESY